MERTLNLLLVLAMITGAVLTYNLKYEAETAARGVNDLRNQVDQARMSISALRAEWASLDQPGRLQGLVERHQAALNLAPFQTNQAVAIEDIPMRQDAAPPSGVPDGLFQTAGALPTPPRPINNPAR